MLDLTPDQLLSTTRAVRKRLDLERPVSDDLIRECVAAALQAPSGGNRVRMGFVVVRDAELKRQVGQVYRDCWDVYTTMPAPPGGVAADDAGAEARQDRVRSSAGYLADHMGDAPALVIACQEGERVGDGPTFQTVSRLANVMPAMWSFMLAARARGLGTSWTTIHLFQEERVAEILGIPFDTVQQVCLSPLAYTIGTDFKPAVRPEPDRVIHWDRW